MFYKATIFPCLKIFRDSKPEDPQLIEDLPDELYLVVKPESILIVDRKDPFK